MTNYNAIFQTVGGKVFELKGLDSAFHLHCPTSDLVQFYAQEHYNRELFVQLKSGSKLIFEQVPEQLMAVLEPNDDQIDEVYRLLLNNNQPKRATDAEIVPVDLKDLLNIVCQMQYHITTSNGLWATDEPDAFKGHPAHHLLWQLWFKPDDTKTSSHESRT
jgi:hypothetical protein